MGLALILIGVLVMLLLSVFWGAVLIVIGIILVFVPGAPYGYSYYSHRRRPPP